MTAHAASHVYFGLDAMWVSTGILLVTYAVIMSEKVNRAIVALTGAGITIAVGVLDQREAIKGIDWNTLGHGIQRVDACRTRQGDLLLVELEDLNPYLSLDLVDDRTRDAFVTGMTASLHHFLEAGPRG